MDDDHVIRSSVTRQTARCLLEPVIREELLGLAEEEPNVQKSILRMSG
jgi:hypothetical protein